MKYSKILVLTFLLSTSMICQSVFPQGWLIQTSGVTSSLRQVVFFNSQTGWAAGDAGKILKTTNGGSTWIVLNSGVTQDLYSIMLKDSATLFAGGAGGTILKTTNGGSIWTSQTSGTSNTLRTFFLYDNTTFYAAGNSGVLLYTSNSGTNWLTYNSNTTEQLNSIYFEDGVSGFVFGNNGAIRRNNGSGPWIVYSFPTSENLLGCGRYPFEECCTNLGNVYRMYGSQVAFNTGVGSALNSVEGKGGGGFNGLSVKTWCAGDGGVIRYSSDTGHTWVGQNSQTAENLYSIFMLDTLRGWIAGAHGTILSTTSGGVIGIQTISSDVPESFGLFQNYPNPFNPGSKIRFQIARSGSARLVVYDLLGRLVKALVDRDLKPGTYETDFDGSGIAGGIYFYVLQSNGFSQTKKMMLVK